MSDKAVCKQIIKTILIDGLVDGASSPPNTSVIHDSNDDDDGASTAGSEDKKAWVEHVTRSGRVSGLPFGWLDPSTGLSVNLAIVSCTVVQNCYDRLQEIEGQEMKLNAAVANWYVEYANVGTRVGGGFERTSKLKPMKYKQAINGPDAEKWKAEIENEHNRMVENKVFTVIKKSELEPGTKIIDSTWACKKKSNGTLRGRLNARGFKQVDGTHYDGSSIHAPVTNPATIRIVLTLMMMGSMKSEVVDVNGHSSKETLKMEK